MIEEEIFEEELEEDDWVCSIEFYYDAVTEAAKYRLVSSSAKEMDALDVFAIACTNIIEKYEDEVIENMEEIMLHSKDATIH